MSKLLKILLLLPFPYLKVNTILFFLLFVPCLAGLARMCVIKVVLWSAVKIVIETPWFSSVVSLDLCAFFIHSCIFSLTLQHTHNYHSERQVPVSNLPYTMAIISLGRSPDYKVPRYVQQLLLCSVPTGWRPWPKQQKQALHWYCSKRRNPSFEKKKVRNQPAFAAGYLTSNSRAEPELSLLSPEKKSQNLPRPQPPHTLLFHPNYGTRKLISWIKLSSWATSQLRIWKTEPSNQIINLENRMI